MPEPRPEQLYYIYRTDGKVFVGNLLGGQAGEWRRDPPKYLVYSDPHDAHSLAADLRKQGHDCSVEVMERDANPSKPAEATK